MIGVMIDLLVILVLSLALLGGWRQGFIASALSALGWLTGVLIGVWATPRFLDAFELRPESELNTALLTLVCALVLGAIGAGTLGHLGQTLARRIPFHPARIVDAGLGALAMGVIALVAVWAGLSSARPLLSADATQQVESAQSWKMLDRAVPDSTRSAVGSLNERFDDSPFPEVFSGSEPQVDVPAPDGSTAAAPAVQQAQASVIKIRSASNQCDGISVGSGWVVSDNRVVTNAHVVAGGNAVTAQAGGSGQQLPAAVVAYDTDLDLAILRVPGLDAPALSRTGDLDRGTPVAAAGFPRGGDYAVKNGRIRTETHATGQDVYNRKPVNREIYLVRATVVSGNSGGPLLTSNGEVAGTVFAKSASNDNTGYALTDDATNDWLNRAPSLTEGVATGDCAPRQSS